jgi:mycothiol synthase
VTVGAPLDIRVRPLVPSDAPAVVDLLLASRAADGIHEPISRDEVRHLWFDHPNLSFATDTLVAVARDGSLAGVVGLFTRDQPASVVRVFMPGAVHPEHRRRGIGTWLLRWAEERGRVLAGAVPGATSRQLDSEAAETALDRIALFERHGFRQARSFVAMRRDLDGVDVEGAEPPLGIAMTPWRTDLDDAARLAHNDAFRDHWGSDPLSAQRWQHFVAGMPGFRTDCSWLALAGDEVVGYTLCTVNRSPSGATVGWLGTIGVRRAWRHQGIASALIRRTLASFAAAGAAEAGLDVDADNPTGAVRVYRALGFRATETSIIFSKPLDG